MFLDSEEEDISEDSDEEWLAEEDEKEEEEEEMAENKTSYNIRLEYRFVCVSMCVEFLKLI